MMEFNWEKIKNYETTIIAKFNGKGMVKFCILCDTVENITWTALWIEDDIKRVIGYYLCDDCGKELQGLPEVQRESIIAKIIEKKIDAFPRITISQLEELGFKLKNEERLRNQRERTC
ncbi:MAG: hypothetical protein OEW62_00910 [Candidatus Bathyarchaeota archaeon]|nr:hypothetical protein [Candidatus Bathyarchaeota archaeon]